MAGARARKLDLSGFLSGSSNVANIVANTDQSGGIGAMLTGIAGGVTRAGANRREDVRLNEARADRNAERDYQHGRDAFRENLALKADARAEADQRLQEDEYKRKVAADAAMVEESAHLLNRAKVSQETGMPMDPEVLYGIGKIANGIRTSGGPVAIMGRAAAQREDDIDGLISQTAQYEALSQRLAAQMGREKNAARHAALGDSFVQLEGVIASNKNRIRLHDANTKRTEADAAKKEDLDALNEDLKRRNALPRRTEKDAMAEAAATGKVVDKRIPSASIEDAKMRLAESSAESRAGTKEDRAAARAASLADGFRDEPWAKGKSDEWIAKYGGQMHAEATKAKAQEILAGKDGVKNLGAAADNADSAYGRALAEFNQLRQWDPGERYPSTQAAWARVEKLRGEADGLRDAFSNAAKATPAAPTTPWDQLTPEQQAAVRAAAGKK